MSLALPFPIRNACPPGACGCEREQLLDDLQSPAARVLRLTREEEKRLIERIASITTLDELDRIILRLRQQLGVVVHIRPGAEEVRTVRGFDIRLDTQPGLCKKTHQTIPAAIRKCLDQHQHIAFAILDAHDLFGMTPPSTTLVSAAPAGVQAAGDAA